MPESRVQLAVEIETQGAEKLTALRRDLEQVGVTGQTAFARLDRSLRDSLESQRRFASSIEPIFGNFFRRLLSGATGFRDTFKRLLRDLLAFFLRTVSQMVAAWLGGFQRISGGSPATGGGGVLSGSLPPILRGGQGVLSSLLPAAGGGGFSATNIDLLGSLGVDLRNLGPLPGNLLASGGLLLALQGFQRGGVGGGLLGAAGGALTGFAFGGPIGAAIGGIIGFFAGLFGGPKNKKRARAAEAEFNAELKRVVDEFEARRIEFQSAIAAIDQGFLGFQDQARQLGKPGRRAIRRLEPEVAAAKREIEELQRAREARLGLINSLPIPEFATGGIVRGINAADGRLLAFLHQGEAVLNRRAVQTVGEGTVERLNSGQGSPTSSQPVSVTVHVHPSSGMDERALAQLTIREIERKLADSGRRLGGGRA